MRSIGIISILSVLSISSAFKTPINKQIKTTLLKSTSNLKQEAIQVKKFKEAIMNIEPEDFTSNNSNPTIASTIDREIEEKPYRISNEEKIKLYIQADVSPADNFYEAMNRMKKNKMSMIDNKEFQKAADLESGFDNLMNYGFMQRFNDIISDDSPKKASLLRTSAEKIAANFDLNKSLEEQAKDLKELRKKQRTGLMKLLPESLYKYVDFLQSLRKKPKSKELFKNIGIGSFFSFVVWVNSNPRSANMYWVIGNLALMSSLLTRNMPEVKAMPGVDKKRVVSWSKSAFKSAVGVCLFWGLSTFLSTFLVLLGLPLNPGAKLKTTAIVSLLSTSYLSAFYEVFEKKDEDGWRWKRAMDGMTSSDEIAKAESKDLTKLSDKYDYKYDPDIDDYPPLPKYIDEVEKVEVELSGGSGEMDEEEVRFLIYHSFFLLFFYLV